MKKKFGKCECLCVLAPLPKEKSWLRHCTHAYTHGPECNTNRYSSYNENSIIISKMKTLPFFLINILYIKIWKMTAAFVKQYLYSI